MSNPNPTEWMLLHQPSLPNYINHNHQTPPSTIFSITTATTTTTIENINTFGPDPGRTSRPIRRRARASRRTPTTVFNTDVTNFRAMVQHYTGEPTNPATATSSLIIPQPTIPGRTISFLQHVSSPALVEPTMTRFQVPYTTHMQQSQQQQMMLLNRMHDCDEGKDEGTSPSHARLDGPSSSGKESWGYAGYIG